MFKPFMSQIMIEAHAAAKADLAWSRVNDPRGLKSYSYYLGLQMRTGFYHARIAVTGTAPCFTIKEPRRLWA